MRKYDKAQLIACIITLAVVVLIGDLVLPLGVVWLVVHYVFHF